MEKLVDSLFTIICEKKTIPYWNRKKQQSQKTCSYGLLVKKQNKKYIVMTNHTTSQHANDYIQIDDMNFKIVGNKVCIPEIDITIIKNFKFENLDDDLYQQLTFIDMDKVDFNLQNIDSDDVLSFLVPDEDGFGVISCFNTVLSSIHYNYLYDIMPSLQCEICEDNLDSIEPNIDCSSGSILAFEDTIMGICSGFNLEKKTVYAVPIFMINRIIMEINKFDCFHGFSKFYFTLTDNEICKDLGIDYNVYHSEFFGKRNKKLKVNDKLIMFDDSIVERGLVFDKNIKIPVSVNDYIKMNKTIDDINVFKIIRNDKEYTITTGNKEIETDKHNLRITKHDKWSNICPELLMILMDINKKMYTEVTAYIKNNKNYKNIHLLLESNDYSILTSDKIIFKNTRQLYKETELLAL
jgi:hypothetical protein